MHDHAGAIQPEGPLEVGRAEPLVASPLPEGCETLGPEVVAWGRQYLGSKLRPWREMPWQGVALDRHLARVDGLWANQVGLTSVARQNGKTSGTARPLVGWWLTEMCQLAGEPQRVLTTAHKLRVASRFFRSLLPVLEGTFGADVMHSYGREELTMPCGCEWHVTAATASAGHSESYDLIICDELWSIGSIAYDDGLMPTIRAKPDPLVSCWSTAGTLDSEVMIRLRNAGLQACAEGKRNGTMLTSWEIPADVDPLDERWWRYANPALGTTIKMDTLRRELRTLPRNTFLRASLNRFVGADKAWLDEGVWSGLAISA